MNRNDLMFDPRPDLLEDHTLWLMTLKTAINIDNETYNVLHGFRCGGAKLVYNPNDQNFKLKMEPRLGDNTIWTTQREWEQYKSEWLMPLLSNIQQIFNTVSKYLENNYSAIVAS
jgi:hypothetical protein